MAIAPLLANHRELITEKFVLAVDLGQSSDPTAIAVLHHKSFKHVRSDGLITPAGQTIYVRHLQRLPLGLSYVEQVGEVARLLARPPLNTPGCEFCLDDTGVGRAVGDLFDNAGMSPIKITLTAGNEFSCVGLNRWHVAKGILISTLDARLHNGELRIASKLADAGALRDELVDFRRKVSAAGRYTFEARVGKHDDLILACAIGLWAIVGRPTTPRAAFGVYSNTIP